jgi:hypothetical protein
MPTVTASNDAAIRLLLIVTFLLNDN